MATYTKVINQQFLFFGLFGLLVVGGVVVVTVIFILRYNRRRHPVPADISGNVWLEIVWVVVPTLIALAMFRIGLTGYLFERQPPPGGMTVKVAAFQFGWRFDYENGKRTQELYVPVDEPVHLELTSQDVIHDFYVPAFRIKQDAVPGMTTKLWFQAIETGEYDVLCAEYCGVGHSGMLTKVVVLPKKEYDAWYASGEETPRERGREEGPAPAGASGAEKGEAHAAD